eukprot:comp23564_c0_seq1/m.39838 comp23564_c0_seq1/g.39838  ORF comp23564_c0_seq1/g.39838 comp23564_c0_seq1/m.39838 type:complete len:313 (-) comp23564_c0_seq1:382-1320(-)
MAVGALSGMTAVVERMARRGLFRNSPRSSQNIDAETVKYETPASGSTRSSASSTTSTECSLTKAPYVVDHGLYVGSGGNVPNDISKREIELRKLPNVEFGASLANVAGGHIIVVMVHEYIMKYGRMFYSPAFMHGLRVGDELVSLNEHDASSLSAEQFEEILYEESSIFLKINEQPGVQVFTLPIPDVVRFNLVSSEPENVFGFTYGKGAVNSVREGLLAHSIGLPVGSSIVNINKKCMLGLSDDDVLCELQDALHGGGDEVIIHTLNASVASGIVTAGKKVLDVVAPSVSVAEAVNRDFVIGAMPLPKRIS